MSAATIEYAVCSCGCDRFVEYGGWRIVKTLVEPIRELRCERCGKTLASAEAETE